MESGVQVKRVTSHICHPIFYTLPNTTKRNLRCSNKSEMLARAVDISSSEATTFRNGRTAHSSFFIPPPSKELHSQHIKLPSKWTIPSPRRRLSLFFFNFYKNSQMGNNFVHFTPRKRKCHLKFQRPARASRAWRKNAFFNGSLSIDRNWLRNRCENGYNRVASLILLSRPQPQKF